MVLETVMLIVGLSSVVSYETTGKGLADHAISTVVNRDCKLVRIVENEKICQSEPVGVVTVNAAPATIYTMGTSSVARTNDIFAERARKSNESH